MRVEHTARLLPVLAAASLLPLALMGPGPAAASSLALALALVALQIAWQDIRTFTISDTALVALGLVALGSRLGLSGIEAEPPLRGLGLAAIEGALCGGCFLAVREVFFRRRGYDGLGFGDVKLAGVGGLLVGIEGFAWTTLAASLGGLAVALAAARLRPAGAVPIGGPRKIPFGALLAPVLLLVWLATAGPALWRGASPFLAYGGAS